jgi:DNA-binding LacI/PurR family transcriptional regulator
MAPQPPPRRQRVTIRDVAAVCDVSVATVSNALHGRGRVSPEMRERVREVAERLGYRASRAARGLRTGRYGAIGLALPVGRLDGSEYLDVDYYLRIAAAAATAAFADGMALTLLPGGVHFADTVEGVDGVLVVDPVREDPRLTVIEYRRVPVVTIDRDLSRPDHQLWVSGDNRANARMLLDELAARGSRRPALLTAPTSWSWLVDTEAAYREWCTEHGIEPDALQLDLERRSESAAGVVEERLGQPEPPDAFLATSEQFAVGALAAVHRRGLEVPGDIQIVAAVDGPGVRGAMPPISALDLRPDEHARAATQLLLAVIEGAEVDAPVLIPAELRLRLSTRP